MKELTFFERSVMKKTLEGNHPVLAVLREQLENATVKERKLTGEGFFLRLDINEDAKLAKFERNSVQIDDVEGEVDGLLSGAGFVVYVKDGRLETLEGFSYEEGWPSTISHFELRFTDPERRLLLGLLK